MVGSRITGSGIYFRSDGVVYDDESCNYDKIGWKTHDLGLRTEFNRIGRATSGPRDPREDSLGYSRAILLCMRHYSTNLVYERLRGYQRHFRSVI